MGAYAVLKERGYEIHRVAGTSAGAIVGSLIAAGTPVDQMQTLMREVDYCKFEDKDFLDRFGVVGRGLSLLFEKGIYEGRLPPELARRHPHRQETALAHLRDQAVRAPTGCPAAGVPRHRHHRSGQGDDRHPDELLRPHAHRRPVRGQTDHVRRHPDVKTTDFQRVFDALRARADDPRFLADLFVTLGPEHASRVPALIAAIAAVRGFDPQEYQRTYADVLNRSLQLRDDTGEWVLDDAWIWAFHRTAFDAPPPPPSDAGSGAFDSEGTGWRDRLTEASAYALAEGADARGYTDAARHLRHYLGASGGLLEVDVGRMLEGDAEYRAGAAAALERELLRLSQQAAERYQGQRLVIPFQSGWSGSSAVDGSNWYYALGSIQQAVSGVMIVEPPAGPGGQPTVRVQYRLHVHDYYNWDKGKSVSIGP